jgi:hypothetical protein
LVLTPLAALAAVWAGANIIRLLAKRKDDRP